VVRLIAQGLTASLGRQVVVDNRQFISIDIVAKAAPDRYTLPFFCPPSWLVPFMRENVSYDPVTDFSPTMYEVEYPLGHRRRRTEGLPLLEAKFETNLARHFPPKRQTEILALCKDQRRL